MENLLLLLPAREPWQTLSKEGSQYHHPAELCPQKGLREEYFQTVRVRGTQSQVARDWENSLIKSSTPGPSLRNRQPGMLQGICVLDPRTVQDHQEHFEDPRCLQRISQAVKQLVDLGGLSIEFNLHGIRQLDFSALTQLLEQGFAPTNLRDVRLIDRGGSIRPQVSDHVCFKLQIKQNLQYSDASRFLEVYVVAARALDPRTARDHRENFEDARCIRRIAQALRELVELGGISIELNSVGSHEVKLAHLTRFLKQYLVETNFRGVRLIDESGGVFELNELLLALMKITESDHVLRSGNPGNQGGLYYLPSDGLSHWSEDNALRNLANMIEDQLSHLRYFASLAPSGYNPKCIHRDEEYENINEIFPNHYGATQVSFLKSLVIDMMCHLRQLGEMCIFPNGHHFYRGK
ncbi:hypothetical protein QWA68_005134 [Fusarium oxysporum]|nr:hypothetical protein QWA68_005134 [Fusarium oxysporum]